jgi:hypothetical protein
LIGLPKNAFLPTDLNIKVVDPKLPDDYLARLTLNTKANPLWNSPFEKVIGKEAKKRVLDFKDVLERYSYLIETKKVNPLHILPNESKLVLGYEPKELEEI